MAPINSESDYIDALLAIHNAIGQHNLLSTATDEERRDVIKKIINAWNEKAVHLLDKFDCH